LAEVLFGDLHMKAYRVTAVSINIHAGVLRLLPDQAASRCHRLMSVGEDRYDVRDPPVSFKRGEVFEIEGELPKAIIEGVQVTEGFSKVEPWTRKDSEKPEKEPPAAKKK
jgi:hypothetical protein